MNHETEDQTRVRRAKEAIAGCRDREDEARKALAAKRARQKYEELFLTSENREAARRKAEYRHATL